MLLLLPLPASAARRVRARSMDCQEASRPGITLSPPPFVFLNRAVLLPPHRATGIRASAAEAEARTRRPLHPLRPPPRYARTTSAAVPELAAIPNAPSSDAEYRLRRPHLGVAHLLRSHLIDPSSAAGLDRRHFLW
jgi:hypothetical protein